MSPVRNTRPIKIKTKISNGVRVIIRNLQKKIPISPKRARQAVLKSLSFEKALKKSGEITVCFVDDKQIRELNLMYLGRDTATDVIAFDDSVKKEEFVADIAVSCQTAVRNARIFKTSTASELYRYVIHGMLHLFGYDDNNRKNRMTMRNRESALLKSINL